MITEVRNQASRERCAAVRRIRSRSSLGCAPREHGLGIPLSKVGFPIRKSTDQSFFAAPRGLSQRSTSFIASQRQGIHRMPLRHLIALIINAHSPRQVTARTPQRPRNVLRRSVCNQEARTVWALTERPACFEIDPQRRAVKRASGYGCRTQLITAYNGGSISSSRCQTTCTAMTDINAIQIQMYGREWSLRRCPCSNQAPKKRSGTQSRHSLVRTKLPNHDGFCRRASTPTTAFTVSLVEPDGIEPTTSCLQSRRSPN